ncbi:unnamed protein product [Clavelina lepadiformis]|uniref:Uncharacterized protein n=1 Tax=Clavelina lepadiformis TaxID=159417 RepID=A0ABP0FRX1_CLALP
MAWQQHQGYYGAAPAFANSSVPQGCPPGVDPTVFYWFQVKIGVRLGSRDKTAFNGLLARKLRQTFQKFSKNQLKEFTLTNNDYHATGIMDYDDDDASQH